MNTLYIGLQTPNADYIHTPLIEIVPVKDDTALKNAVFNIGDYAYVLFTSRYAVRFFCQYGLPEGDIRVVSIGPTTTQALQEIGVRKVTQVERDDSYGVIDWFCRQPRGRVLIPRSDIALSIIPDGLRQLGFDVTTVTAYRNRMPSDVRRIDLNRVDRIVFTSPSTVDNFVYVYGSLPQDKILVTRGRTTQERLNQYLKNRKPTK
ncbi:MAG: uroporphyrinogen-III synthase [Prevotella sp.]|nr:uroporphyrinogen-III synthase [Prevotella sp.]